MSRIKTKELIICIITIAILVLTIVTDVFATDNAVGVNGLPQPNNTNTNTNTNFSQIPTNTNVNTNTNTNTNANTNTNTNVNKNNTTAMPNTGVDYSVVFIIAICGISAIYAYKKIKDYNNF